MAQRTATWYAARTPPARAGASADNNRRARGSPPVAVPAVAGPGRSRVEGQEPHERVRAIYCHKRMRGSRQLQDAALELAAESALVGCLPLLIDDLEGDVLVRCATVEAQQACVGGAAGVGQQGVAGCLAAIDQIRCVWLYLFHSYPVCTRLKYLGLRGRYLSCHHSTLSSRGTSKEKRASPLPMPLRASISTSEAALVAAPSGCVGLGMDLLALWRTSASWDASSSSSMTRARSSRPSSGSRRGLKRPSEMGAAGAC
eukprot:scaffold258324_cov27-Tisochrysis_lutea.AAC.2